MISLLQLETIAKGNGLRVRLKLLVSCKSSLRHKDHRIAYLLPFSSNQPLLVFFQSNMAEKRTGGLMNNQEARQISPTNKAGEDFVGLVTKGRRVVSSAISNCVCSDKLTAGTGWQRKSGPDP